jgi:hypothetical protein
VTARRAQRILDALGVQFRVEVEAPVLEDRPDGASDQEAVAA